MKNSFPLIQSFSKVALANFISKPLWVLLFIYAARVLGAEQFGIYTFALSIVIISSIFIDFGFDYLAIRDISQDNSKLTKVFNEVFLTRILFSLIAFLILIAYAFLADSIQTPQFQTIIVLLIFQTLTIVNQFLKSIVSAFHDFSNYSLMIAGEKLLICIFGFMALVISNKLSFFLLAIVFAVLLSTVFFLLFLVKKYTLKFQLPVLQELKVLLINSFPLLVMNIFIMAYFRVDVILLDFLIKDKSTVGIYGTIHRIVEMYFLFPTIIMSTAYPIIAKNLKENSEFVNTLLNKILYFLAAFTLPIVILLSLNSFYFNKIVFGQEYLEGYKGLAIIVWTILPLGLNYVLGYLLISINKQFFCALTIAIASVINISLNFLLIPEMSFVGTSIATLSTEIIIFIFYAFFTRKFFAKVDLVNLVWKLVLIISITLITFLIVNKYYDYNFIFYSTFFPTLTLILIVYTGLVKIGDVKLLLKQLKSQKENLKVNIQ